MNYYCDECNWESDLKSCPYHAEKQPVRGLVVRPLEPPKPMTERKAHRLQQTKFYENQDRSQFNSGK